MEIHVFCDCDSPCQVLRLGITIINIVAIIVIATIIRVWLKASSYPGPVYPRVPRWVIRTRLPPTAQWHRRDGSEMAMLTIWTPTGSRLLRRASGAAAAGG